MSPLAERITAIIREALAVEVPSPTTDLIATGLIDSLALVSLIVEIETELGVELPLDDFDPDRFRTVETMAAFAAEAGGSA
jgi:D-alanine--poly(phosphoribitol) ligase subunit 2